MAIQTELAREYNKRYYAAHKGRRAEIMRRYRAGKGKDYEKLHKLAGKQLSNGETKRAYTGYCELCGVTYENDKNRFHYHHWIESEPTFGIWVCVKCHWMIEGVDTGILQKYEELKPKIEKECTIALLHRLGLSEVLNGQEC